MISEAKFVGFVADLINRDSNQKQREGRVREAHQALYREVVNPHATAIQADLALAKAAQKERDRR